MLAVMVKVWAWLATYLPKQLGRMFVKSCITSALNMSIAEFYKSDVTAKGISKVEEDTGFMRIIYGPY